MKVTLKDISEDTGYSISTISRVLNGSQKISTKTRREVYHSAKKLNYPLQHSPNGDAFLDTLNIGLILTRFDIGEFYASYYSGFNNAAEAQDIQLSLSVIDLPLKEAVKRITKLVTMKMDGLILFAPQYRREDYKLILEALPDKYPIVSNGLIENPVLTTVTFDGYSGGYSAAEHFHQRGYARCGMIRGAFDAIEARYRSNGFKDYIQKTAGMELIWNFGGDFSFESGKEAFKAFRELEEKPRAVFASNDEMGHAFIEEAIVEGYDIPADVAIVSYDDLPICERHHPGISSVHTDYQTLGEVTLEKLKDILTNPKQEKSVLSLVPVDLIVRETS